MFSDELNAGRLYTVAKRQNNENIIK